MGKAHGRTSRMMIVIVIYITTVFDVSVLLVESFHHLIERCSAHLTKKPCVNIWLSFTLILHANLIFSKLQLSIVQIISKLDPKASFFRVQCSKLMIQFNVESFATILKGLYLLMAKRGMIFYHFLCCSKSTTDKVQNSFIIRITMILTRIWKLKKPFLWWRLVFIEWNVPNSSIGRNQYQMFHWKASIWNWKYVHWKYFNSGFTPVLFPTAQRCKMTNFPLVSFISWIWMEMIFFRLNTILVSSRA